MSEGDRLRLDVWLWRARFVKTRALAASMIAEGGVRLIRDGASRQIDKAATAVAPGDALAFRLRGSLKVVRIEGLGTRRGPPAEARALYSEIEAEPNPDIAGLA